MGVTYVTTGILREQTCVLQYVIITCSNLSDVTDIGNILPRGGSRVF